MPNNFKSIDKYCEICGKKLLLKNTRDIIRKRFCSRKCCSSFTGKYAMLGKKHSDQTRELFRKQRYNRDDIKDWTNIIKSCKLRNMGKGLRNDNSKWVYKIQYKGITFRSRWEVFLAILLDLQNRFWLYEPRRFDLGRLTYLPDFYLPDENLYIEVKGFMDNRSLERITKFKKLYPKERLEIFNKESLKNLGLSGYKVSKIIEEVCQCHQKNMNIVSKAN